MSLLQAKPAGAPVQGAAGSLTSRKPAPHPPQISTPWRISAGVVAVAVLGWAAYLGYENYTGVATAAFLAAAILFGVICFAGVVPVNLKVGDTQIQFAQRAAIQQVTKSLNATRDKIKQAGGDETKKVAAIVDGANTLRNTLPAADALPIEDIMALVSPPEAGVDPSDLHAAASKL